MASDGKKLLLAIPLYNAMTVLDAIGPFDMLHMLPNVDVVFVAEKRGWVESTLGLCSIKATHSFDEVPCPDIILVPGGLGTDLAIAENVDEFGNKTYGPLVEWVKKVHPTTCYTTSVCTGALVLGAAGVLGGLTVTTHWTQKETLKKYGATYMNKRWVRNGKIWTSAGVSAGIDMGLMLASVLKDVDHAKALQLYAEYDPEPPFNAGSPGEAGDQIIDLMNELILPVVQHIEENYGPGKPSVSLCNC